MYEAVLRIESQRWTVAIMNTNTKHSTFWSCQRRLYDFRYEKHVLDTIRLYKLDGDGGPYLSLPSPNFIAYQPAQCRSHLHNLNQASALIRESDRTKVSCNGSGMCYSLRN